MPGPDQCRLMKCDGTAPLPSSENEQGLPRSLAASKCSTALFYSFAAPVFLALKSSRLLNAGRETASVDLRAPRDVIDGRLRRVKPNPAMETEGESRACGLMRLQCSVPAKGRAHEGAAVLSGLTKG